MFAESQKNNKFIRPIFYVGVFFIIALGAFTLPKIQSAAAKACTSNATGDWTTAGTWTAANSCNVAGGPIAGDTITIAAGHSITISTVVAAASISISANSANTTSINMTGGSLTLSSTLTCVATSSANTTTTIAVGAQTLSAAGITLNGGSASTRICLMTLSTGTVTTTAGLTFAGSTVSAAKISSTGAATIKLTGTMSGAGTVSGIFNTTTLETVGVATLGAAYAWPGKLQVDNGSTLTLNNSIISIAGTTLVGQGTSGILQANSGTHTALKTFTGAVTVSAGATFDLSAGTAVPATFGAGITQSSSVQIKSGAGAANLAGNLAGSGNGGILFGAGLTVTTTQTTSNGYTGGTVTVTGAMTYTGNWTQAANSSLRMNSTNSGAGVLTAVASPNTVTYGATATMKASASHYNNLILAAGTLTAVADTIDGTLTISAGTLTLPSGAFTVTGATSITGTLANASGATAKTFTGLVTVNSGGVVNLTTATVPAVNFAGGITASSGAGSINWGTGATAFTATQAFAGAANMTFGGTSTISNTFTLTNNNTGTITFTDTLNGGGASANFVPGNSSGASYTKFGAAPMATGTITPSTSANTVDYTYAAPTVKAPTTNPYYSLTLSGSGTAVMSASVTSLNGSFTLSGTVTTTTVAVMVITGDVVIGTGTTFNINHNLTINGGDMTTAGTGIINTTANTPTVTISGTGNIGGGGAVTVYNLTTSGSGTSTLTSAITVTNDLAVGTGTTIGGAFGMTVNGGDATGDGTINLTAGTFLIDGAGNFGGATGWTFKNLTFGNGSGTTTTTATGAGSIAVTGTQTVAVNQTLDAGSKTWNLSGTGSVAAGSGPTLVQHVGTSNTGASGTSTSPGSMHVQLPQGTQAGNCIIVGWQFDNTSTPTLTVTDDQSNTYVNIIDATDSVNSQRLGISLATNVTANTRQINIGTAGATISGFQSAAISEYYNCSTAAPATAADGSQATTNHGQGTSTSITAGSTAITPTQTGDLLWQMAVQTNRDQTFTVGSQSNITWAFNSIDSRDGMAVQAGVYNSVSAITPTFTQGSSAHFASVAIAVKAAVAGSDGPAGMRIKRSQHISLWAAANGGPGYTSPTVLPFPSDGNLLIAAAMSGNSGSITAISDNINGSWSKCGAGQNATPHHADMWYFGNATTASNLITTITSSANTIDSTIVFYDVAGAATSGVCDLGAGTSGLQNTIVSTINGPSITPTTTSGLIFAEFQQEFNTIDSTTSPSGALIDSQYFDRENVDGPENFDQNGGWSHVVNTSTSAKSWTWHFITGSTAQQNWITYAAAFKAGSSIGSPLIVNGVFTVSSSTFNFNTISQINIPAYTYNNLGFKPVSGSPSYNLGTGTSQTITVGGTFTVGNGSNVVTVTGNTYAPTITVTGGFTVAASGSFVSTVGNLNLAGDFTNNGTFSSNGGTVVFTGAVVHNIAGSQSTTFHHMTDITDGSSLKFKNDAGGTTPTYTFNTNGVLTVTGGASKITITSDTQATNPWLVFFTTAQSAVTNAIISWSGCAVSSATVTLDATSTNSGNNGTCWSFPSTITISGNIYSDAGTTPLSCAVAKSVRVKVNGAGSFAANCSNTPSTGYFTIPSIVMTASAVVTVFLDEATEKAVVVTHSLDATTNMTINLYQNYVIIRHEDAVAVTNTNLDVYDSTCSSGTGDTDIQFCVTSGALTVTAGSSLLVWSGKTFSPGGTVSTQAMVVDGTLSSSNNVTVSAGGVTGNGTITLTGTSTFIQDGTGNFGGNTAWTFNNLQFGDGSGSTTTTATGSGAITVNGGQTVKANQTLLAGSKTWNLNGTGASSPNSGVPTVVQHVSTSSSRSAALTVSGYFRVRMPNTTLSGNAIVVAAQVGATIPTIAVTDDGGNTYNQIAHTSDTTHQQDGWIFVALNTAPARVISIQNTSGTDVTYVSAVATEFNNVATASAADGNNGNFGTSATATAGSITPTTSGDLLYQFVARDSSPIAARFTAGSQANITWQLLSADTSDGNAAQWGIYNSTSAINSQMTMTTDGSTPSSTGFLSVVVALKAASAGTPRPSGMRVVGIHHLSQPNGVGDPYTAQVPVIGNMLVAAHSSGSTSFIIVGITDSNGNTWSSTGADNSNGILDNTQIFYQANETPNAALTVTVDHNGTTPSDATIFFYDVAGADPSPFDIRSVSNGTQTSAGNLSEPPSLTPTTANGLIIMEEQHEWTTAISLTGSNQLFDSTDYDGEPVDGPTNMDQNGGWGHYYNPDTSAVSFTWTFRTAGSSNGGPLAQWSAYAAAFIAGPVASSPFTVESAGVFTAQTSTINYGGTASLTVPALTYNNVAFIPTSGSPTYSLGTATTQTLTANGTFTVGDGSHAVTVSGLTYDPTITVAGAYLVAASSTFISTGGNLNLAGNFTNNGTFTANSGTVIFTGSGNHNISGATTFHHVNAVTASATLTFTHGQIFTWDSGGTFTVNGQASGTHVTITSDTTAVWLAHFTSAQSAITNVTLIHSGCDSGTATVTLDSTATNDPTSTVNDTSCWIFPAANILLQGNLYTDDATTVPSECNSSTAIVKARFNSVDYSAVACTSGTGAFSITGPVSAPGAGTLGYIWIDGATCGGNNSTGVCATTVIRYLGSSNVTSIKLRKNRLVLRSDSGSFTDTDLSGYTNSNDADLVYAAVASTSLTTEDQIKLVVDVGTFAPAGTVTTDASSSSSTTDGDLTISSGATLSMAANALQVGGDFANAGTFSYSGGQTTTFTATATGHTIEDGTNNFDTLVFNGSGGAWTPQSAITTVGSLTVTAGTLTLAGNAFTVATTSSISGTVNTATSSSGTKTFTGAVTIASGGTMDMSNQNPVVAFGAGITQSSSILLNAGSGSDTLIGNLAGSGSGGITFGGALAVSSGTTTNSYTGGTVTVTGAMTFTGNWAQGANSLFTMASSNSGSGTLDASTNTPNTVTYSGTATVKAPTSAYYNLTTSGTATGVATTVNNNFTVSAGTYTLAAGAFTVTGATSITGALANATGATAKTFTGAVTVNSGGSVTLTTGTSPALNFAGGITASTGAGTVNWGTGATAFTANQNLAGAVGMTFGGAITVSPSATLTNNNTNTITFSSTIALSTSTTAGNITNNGTITETGALSAFAGCSTCTFTNGATGTFNYGSATAPLASVGTLTTTATGNIVNYTAAAPTCKAVTYDILNFTGSGSVTCATTTVTNSIALSGTVSWTTTSSIAVTTSVTVGSGTTLVNGAFTLTSPTITVTNSMTNNGTVTVSTALAGGGTFTNGAAGILNIGVATGPSVTTFVATASGNTVNYTASTPTCRNVTYDNLTFSGASGAITCVVTAPTGTVSVTGGETWTTSLTSAGAITLSGTAAVVTGAGVAVTGTITVGTGTSFTNGNFTSSAGTVAVTSSGTFTNNGTMTINTALSGTGTFTNSASKTLNIGFAGPPTITILDATAASNIVNYTSAAPFCLVTTYINLNFTGSGAVTCALSGATVTNLATSGTVTWTLSSAFTVGGTLTVGTGTAITTSSSALTVTGATSISGTLHLTGNGSSKTFTALVTVNNGGTLDGASTTIVTTAGIANAGTVSITGTDTMSTAGANFSGANNIAIATLDIPSPGSVTNNGTVTTSTALSGSSGTFINGATGTLNIGFATAPTITTLNVSTSGNIVNYTAAAPSCKVTQYDTLNFTGSGSVTCAVTTVANLGLSGTVSLTTTSNITASGTVTVATGTTLVNANGPYTLTAATMTVNSTGAVTNNSIVTISGTFSGSGTWTQGSGSTLNVGGGTTNAIAITNFDASTNANTVNYNGAAQTVKDPTSGTAHKYSSLTLSGSGAKTLITTMTDVLGNLTLSGTASATTTGNLLVGGTGTIGNGTTLTQGNGFTLEFDGTLTVGGGSTGVFNCAATASTLTLKGDLTLAVGSTWTKTNCGTLTFSKGAAQAISDSTASGQDLGTVVTATASTSVSTSTNVKLSSLNIVGSTTFDISSDTLTLTGTSTPLTVSGTFTITGSTVAYTGATATVTATTFNNLNLGTGAAGTYTMPATSPTLRGNLLINAAGITKGAGTIVFAKGAGGTQTITDNTASDLGALQVSANSGTSQLNMASDVKVTSLAIDANQLFSANGSNTLTILGNSNPLTVGTGATFTPSTGTVAFVSAATSGTTIPATTFNNLSLNKTSNTFTGATGTLSIAGNLLITAGTLDLTANDPTTTVGGTTTITGTLLGSNSSTLTIKGDWTNNGTYTHNNGTVIVDFSSTANQGTINITGSTTPQAFYSLTAATAAGGKILKFKSGSTFTFAGLVTLTGTPGSPLKLAAITPTSQWIATLSGTSALNYLTVVDSGCSGGNNWTVNDTVFNLGNNGSCWTFISRGGGGVIGANGGGSGSGGGSGVSGGNSGGGGSGESGTGGGNPSGTLAIDASTPVRFAGTPADNTNITSASFTPPANSLLLVMVNADTAAATSITISVTDSTALTWTKITQSDYAATSVAGHASAWYALKPTSEAMTVSAKRTTTGGGSNEISVKVYVLTGYNTTSQIGASNNGSSTTNNITPSVYTSTFDNSVGFAVANDKNALGLPASSDTYDAAHYSVAASVLSTVKAAPTSISGTVVTMNFDASGSSTAAWNWVAVEIKPFVASQGGGGGGGGGGP